MAKEKFKPFDKSGKVQKKIFDVMSEYQDNPEKEKEPIEITLYHLCIALEETPTTENCEIWREKIYREEKPKKDWETDLMEASVILDTFTSFEVAKWALEKSCEDYHEHNHNEKIIEKYNGGYYIIETKVKMDVQGSNFVGKFNTSTMEVDLINPVPNHKLSNKNIKLSYMYRDQCNLRMIEEKENKEVKNIEAEKVNDVEVKEDHTGMTYNPYTDRWSFL